MLDELARQSALALGRCAPNPGVAAVLLSVDPAGRAAIVSSGATEPPGGRHAEIVALDQAASVLAPGAGKVRLYVSLEPCTHWGRTPPCTDRILSAAWPQTIRIGCLDHSLDRPGLNVLRQAGRRAGRWRASRRLAHSFLDGFLMRSRGEGPRLHLKMAADASDGMGDVDRRVTISGPRALAFGQLLRGRCDASLVGPRTSAVDQPRLDARPIPAEQADALAEVFQRCGDWYLRGLGLALREIAYDSPRQSRRMFLVTGFFEGAERWLQMQASLNGPPPEFLPCEGADPRWTGRLEQAPLLPSPRSADFGRRLRLLLAERGLNDVLIECGPGLFQAIYPALRPGDRLYLLQSKAKIPTTNAEAPRLPRSLVNGRFRELEQIDLGVDTLSLQHVID